MAVDLDLDKMSVTDLQELDKKLKTAIPKATRKDRMKAYREARDIAKERGFDIKDLVDEFYRKRGATPKKASKKSEAKDAQNA